MASGAVIEIEGSPISAREAAVNGPAWRRTIYENAGGDIVSEFRLDQDAAATQISSLFRGFRARRMAQRLREEHERREAEKERQRRLESERRTQTSVINEERHASERNRAWWPMGGRAHVPIHGLRRGRNEGNSAGNFWISAGTRKVLVFGTCFHRDGDQRWGVGMSQREYCPTSEIISRVDGGKKFLCRCNCDPHDYL
jgi:hypothetical protein